MKVHPALAPFPTLDEIALSALAIDVKTNGLINPIVLCEEQVLDGRARLAACERARLKPRFHTFPGDPYAFALQANAGRTMTQGQRILAAARLAVAWEVSRETPEVSGETPVGDRTAAAARALGVSRASAFRAKRLLDDATLVAAVERGELNVREAFRRVQPPDRRARAKATGMVAVATAAERLQKRALMLREDLHGLCADVRARKLLEDTLQDLSRELYAIADGSAYAAEEPA